MKFKSNFSNTLLLVCAFSVSMLMTNCSSNDDSSNSTDISIITPGVGIGELTLNLTSSEVEDILGEGQKDVIDVIFITIQTLTYADLGIIVGFNPITGTAYQNNANVVGYNVIGNYEGATPEGIKIGSSRADVVAAYGEPDNIDADGLEEYTTRGINFEYDASMNVSLMAIY